MKGTTLLALLPVLALAPIAPAVTLAPGQSGVPDDFTLPGPNDVNPFEGMVGAVPLFYPYDPAPGGTSSGVRLNTVTHASTFLFTLSLKYTLPLSSVEMVGYQGFSVDAGFLQGNTRVPFQVSRSADGDTLSFQFDPAAPNDGTSTSYQTTLIVKTNATDFTTAARTTLDFTSSSLPGGAYATSAPAIGPVGASGPSAVPEISSLSALLAGCAGLTLRYRRRA